MVAGSAVDMGGHQEPRFGWAVIFSNAICHNARYELVYDVVTAVMERM